MRKPDSGATLVEFALTFSLIILTLYGILDIGWRVYKKGLMVDRATRAARDSAVRIGNNWIGGSCSGYLNSAQVAFQTSVSSTNFVHGNANTSEDIEITSVSGPPVVVHQAATASFPANRVYPPNNALVPGFTYVRVFLTSDPYCLLGVFCTQSQFIMQSMTPVEVNSTCS